MEIDEETQAELVKLPAGPWHTEGPWVIAGNQPVCIISEIEGYRTHQQACELARIVARLPERLRLLTLANPDVMQARIEELEQEKAELEALRAGIDRILEKPAF